MVSNTFYLISLLVVIKNSCKTFCTQWKCTHTKIKCVIFLTDCDMHFGRRRKDLLTRIIYILYNMMIHYFFHCSVISSNIRWIKINTLILVNRFEIFYCVTFIYNTSIIRIVCFYLNIVFTCIFKSIYQRLQF